MNNIAYRMAILPNGQMTIDSELKKHQKQQSHSEKYSYFDQFVKIVAQNYFFFIKIFQLFPIELAYN